MPHRNGIQFDHDDNIMERRVIDLSALAGAHMVRVELTYYPSDRVSTLAVYVGGQTACREWTELTPLQMRAAMGLAARLYEYVEREDFFPSQAALDEAEAAAALVTGDVTFIPSPRASHPVQPEPWFPGKDERDDKEDGETPDSATWGA